VRQAALGVKRQEVVSLTGILGATIVVCLYGESALARHGRLPLPLAGEGWGEGGRPARPHPRSPLPLAWERGVLLRSRRRPTTETTTEPNPICPWGRAAQTGKAHDAIEYLDGAFIRRRSCAVEAMVFVGLS